VPVISVRLMIAKPERLPTWTRMLASRSFFLGSVSATGSYSAQLAASLRIGPRLFAAIAREAPCLLRQPSKQFSPYVPTIPFHDIVTLASCPSR
jgi:hypothetical protein